MKRQKIIRLINEMWGDLADANDKLCLITDDIVDIFRLGMKHGEKEYKKKQGKENKIFFDLQFGNVIAEMESAIDIKPETNKSGGYIDNPDHCDCMKKCVLILKSDRGNKYPACKDVVLKCNFDKR